MPQPNRIGRFEVSTVGGERVRAHIPPSLPPTPLDLVRLQRPLEAAQIALGQLEGVSSIIPDPQRFLYAYVRKEAVLSSQIEGTQSSLSDLLAFEAEAAPTRSDDLIETSNYVTAMTHGLQRLKEGFPLSLRLIREIHSELLASGRGSHKQPGAFRTSQNWIGGTRPGNAVFVPPPAHLVPELMGDLELYLHKDDDPLPLLLRAGIAHVQFETIHPFLDGNGRVGRLLVTFILCAGGALSQPLLYLSLFLKRHRDRYYDLLQAVRTHGAWEEWLAFFLEGVATTAKQAFATARETLSVFREDKDRLASMGRKGLSVGRVLDCLQTRPIATPKKLGHETGLSHPTVAGALDILVRMGIVREISGRARDRVYAYARYLDILNRDSEPLST